MSAAFDGYHVWLGIPPDEQPPNHYRLLGIAPFENDADVIDHAADRQMAHVRTFQAGKNRAVSQQLLNELAAARVCLLNAERKKAYDNDLRAKTAKPAKAVPVAAPVAKATPVAVAPKAAPVATAIPKAVPGGTSAPVKTGSDDDLGPLIESEISDIPPVSAAASFDADKELKSDFGDELDDERFAAAAKTAEFKIQPKRRQRRFETIVKNPATVGIVAGVIAISFFLLYSLVVRLASSEDLRQFILHGPQSAPDAALEPGIDATSAPPPRVAD